MHRVLAFALLVPAAVHGASFVTAFHDARTDEIVVDIAYQGARPGHDFVVHWEECDRSLAPHAVTGQVVDRNGDDVVGRDFEVRMRFDASSLPCRPALATLRIGSVSNLTVFVPERQSVGIDKVR